MYRCAQALASKKAKALIAQLKPVEAATNEAEFVAAIDKLTVYVIGEKSIPEGVPVKGFVRRITDAVESLPQKGYPCEKTRTNNGVCYNAGPSAMAAYEASLKEIRKYSMIQLGDYRKVEFRSF